MIHVLEINTSSFTRLGITIHLLNYYRHINPDEISADFIANRNVDMGLVGEFEAQGFRIIRLPSRDKETFSYFVALTKLIRKEKYDIVRVHGSSGLMLIEMLAAYFARCKVRIVHSHNTKTDHVLLSRILLPFLNCITTVRFACGIDAGKYLFGNKKFEVMKNGVDIDRYAFNPDIRNKVREDLGFSNQQVVVAHVGNITVQKNHPFLMEIFAELSKLSPIYNFVCVGKGDMSLLERNALKNNIKDKLNILGERKDVPDLLQAFDIMVLPSLYEGFPIVAVEWQTAGLPCFFSTSVTTEVKIAQEVFFLDVDEGPVIWAQSIHNYVKNHNQLRYCGEYYVESSGYSIYQNSLDLVSRYHSLVEGSR